MPESAVIRARIDERTKAEASAVLAAMGLTVSDAFRLLMVRVAKEKSLPFELRTPKAKSVRTARKARAGQPSRRTAKQQFKAWAKLRGRATVKMKPATLLAHTRGGATRVAPVRKSSAHLSSPARPKSRIRFGALKGKVKVAKDFDAPLPSDV